MGSSTISSGQVTVDRVLCDCTILIKSTISVIDGDGASEFKSACSSTKDQLIHEPVHPESRRALVSKMREESSLVSRITRISSLVLYLEHTSWVL